MSVRDEIRSDLLDAETLEHLKGCGSINWNTTPTWQCQAVEGGGDVGGGEGQEWVSAGPLTQYLEVSGAADVAVSVQD